MGSTSTVYDLAGVPSMIWHDYTGSGFDLDTLEEMFYRDSAGRVWGYNFFPDQGYGAQVDYGYDRLGRLSSIYMDGAAEVTLGYDIHGWPLWQRPEPAAAPATEWRLGYAGGAAPRYSGSISSRQWSGGRYDYRYDLSGRLYGAVHTAPSGAAPGTDFSATYGYDALGNLTSVTRQGVVERTPGGAETFGAVDDHTIDVVAARPERIERRRFHVIEPPIVLYGVGAVSPSEPIESHDLTYDESGRLVSDGSRGISAVTYNYDGLPVSISFTDGHTQNNVYDGLGRLMQTSYSVFTPGVVGAGVPGGTIAVTGVRRYTGDGHVLYSGGGLYPRTYTLERHHFADGYLDGAGDAHFLVRDYRGNVTDVIAADGSVEQHTDYYPCGLPWRAVSGVNRRLFEGKEYLTDDGLDEYDYGARRYTPRFGMFTTPDPHGWRTPWLSAYCAFACNPVMNIDPTGEDAIVSITEDRITISANIILEGELATQELADAYYNKIMDVWGSVKKIVSEGYSYEINWDVNVRVAEDGEVRDLNGINNYFEVVRAEVDGRIVQSEVKNNNIGKIRESGRYGRPLAQDNPAAHEFGHLLGLKDRYGIGNSPAAWQGNVMKESTDEEVKVDSRNMTGILGRALSDYHKKLHQFQSNPANLGKRLNGTWYINHRNREK